MEHHSPQRHLHGVSPTHLYRRETAREQDKTLLQGVIPETHSVLDSMDGGLWGLFQHYLWPLHLTFVMS